MADAVKSPETHTNDVPFRPQRDAPADKSLLTKPAVDIVTATPIPPVTFSPAQSSGGMKVTAAPGSFAAGLKAMMDEARAGIQQARADGTAKVQEAVGKLADAKTATAKVAGNIASTIENEAAEVMAELGQISNDLGA